MPVRFIDRSRWESYFQHCPRAAYLTYWAGPTQHGFKAVAASLPLTTGTYTHGPLAAVAELVRQEPRVILDDPARYIGETRQAIREAQDFYRRVVTYRGFDDASRVATGVSGLPAGLSAEEADLLDIPIEDDAQAVAREIAHTIEEQNALIEAFTWMYALWILPSLLDRYTIVAVEQEEVFVVPGTCTCGRGDFDPAWRAHAAAGCEALIYQSKPDLVLQRLSDGGYEYHEMKTASMVTKDSREQWEHRPQFLVGIRGVEARLGIPDAIDSAAVHHFIKGKRQGDYVAETGDYGGPKRQQSSLVYCYHRPENLPTHTEDWQPSWKWFDGQRNRTLGKTYTKEPVWLQRFPLPEDDPGMSPVEYWVRALTEEQLQKHYTFVGPLPRQRFMEEGYVQSVRLWDAMVVRPGLEGVREALAVGDVKLAKEYLDSFFPQSWDCHPFGTGKCTWLDVCTGLIPLERLLLQPEQVSKYEFRLPHHQPEMDYAVEEGWLAAPAEDVATVQETGEE